MGFAQDVKKKTESIRTGAFKSGTSSGPSTPVGGMVAGSGPKMDEYGYCGDNYPEDLKIAASSPAPSMMSAKSGRMAGFGGGGGHVKGKLSRGGGAMPTHYHQGHPPTSSRPISAYSNIGGGGSFSNLIHDDYRPLMDELKDIYRRKIRPLETTYNFEGFHSAPLSDSDIEAKPMVLLLGQYST
ncbi:3-hydroxyisobutyryl-CoA hydrolase, partial [Podila humilis]